MKKTEKTIKNQNERDSGIELIGKTPWGTHLCQFYQSRDDLIDILAPYFKAGLENNEFCMWVTSDPLNVKDATAALKNVVKNVNEYIKSGQLEILDYSEWYTQKGKFDADSVLAGWVEKEKQAIKNGFSGLRLTGNTFWLEKEDWEKFKDYEETVNKVIGQHKMLAICSYSLDRSDTSEVLDVVTNHQFALIRRDGNWEIIESSERKRAEKALMESEEKYKSLLDNISDTVIELDVDGNVSYISSQFKETFGHDPDKVIGQSAIEYVHPDDLEGMLDSMADAVNEKKIMNYEYRTLHKDGHYIPVSATGRFIKSANGSKYLGVVRDITERKRADETLKISEEKYRRLVNNLSDVIMETDTDGNIVYLSPQITEILGYSEDELIGKNAFEYIHIDDLEEIMVNIEKTLNKGEVGKLEYRIKHKKGHFVPVIGTGRIIEDGKKKRFMVVIKDITEIKHAQEEVEKLAKFPAQNPNPVLRIAKNGTILYSNDASKPLLAHWKYKPGQKLAKKWLKFITNALKNDEPQMAEVEYGGKVFSLMFAPITEAGFVNVYGLDVTERKEAEFVLKESEERYRQLTESITDGVLLLDHEWRYLLVNEKITQMTGLSEEKLLGNKMSEIFPGVEESGLGMLIKKVQKTKKAGVDTQMWTYEDGRTQWYENRVYATKNGILVISSDITDRKHAEEALQESDDRYSALFNRSRDGVYIHDFEGNFLEANSVALNMFDYSKDQITTFNISSLLSEDQLPLALDTLEELMETGSQRDVTEFRLKHKDGRDIWVETKGSVIYKHGKPFAVQGIARDVTERKMAEEKIKNSLKEKEVLLQEVHHRVKNNMQVITSLLKLQAKDIKDKRTAEMFMESQNRIRSMAQVHESLYRSKNFADINVNDYIKNLTNSLFRNYKINPEKVVLNMEVGDISLGVDHAIPCGLIINELVSNSLKYAFPKGKLGHIDIKLSKKRKGALELTVSDNGVGLPADQKITKAETLGLYLVNILVKDQLQGNIKVERDIGTKFQIEFTGVS